MKIAPLRYLVEIFFFLSCTGQMKNGDNVKKMREQVKGDTIRNMLHEYKVDSCLIDLLTSVVEADKQSYDKDKEFYSLTYELGKDYRYIRISYENRSAVKYFDYIGLIKINGVPYLCRGAIGNDSLFQKTDKIESWVSFRPIKDSADLMPFPEDPLLQGAFTECRGMPINLEIYSHNIIPGYNMKDRSSIRKNK